MRHVLIVLAGLTALALASGLQASADTGTRPAGPGGIVPPVANSGPRLAATRTAAGPARVDNLGYHGGPVMHSTNNYAIYWVPPGYSVPGTYEGTTNQYFSDIAADSGATGNVYAAATQYRDTNGPVAYDASFGGSVEDTNSFPPTSVSTDPAGNSTACGTYPGQDSFQLVALQNCLSDGQLQNEIQTVAATQGWTPSASTMFFIYTPEHVGSCFSHASCAYQYYCAYHDSVTLNGKTYIYAVIPYPNEASAQRGATVCGGSGEQYPNAADSTWDARAADQAINLSSHEHNEAITDPRGNGWWVDSGSFAGDENGDLCVWAFGGAPVTAGSNSSNGWDQAINGDHYFIQGEWSNKAATSVGGSGCVWDNVGPTSDDPPGISGVNLVGEVLTGDVGTWTGSPTSYTYSWLRCNTEAADCSTIVKRTATAADPVDYTLVRADDKHTIMFSVSAKNGAGSASAASFATDVVGGEPEGATPTIDPTATVGQVVTGDVDDAGWTFPATSYKVLWERCDSNGSACAVIKSVTLPRGVTSATYKPVVADDKHTLVFGVIASNAVGSSFETESDPTAIVDGEPENGTPAASAPPALVGAPVTLDLAFGSWSFAPTSYRVEWTRCALKCVTIKAGTVSATRLNVLYTPVIADDKLALSAKVTAMNAAGSSDPVTVAFGTVAGEPEGASPRLTGTAVKGSTLTVDPDTPHWSYAPTTYTFKWLRCVNPGSDCAVFLTVTQKAGAPAPTYKLTSADVAKYLQVRVVATNASGSSTPTLTNVSDLIAITR